MPAIQLLFLWHMHQPYYKDLVSGEYRLPWVRLHALKDYYGMVRLLDEFPGIHQTFNLVPSLIVQIQDYASGNARDPFLQVAARPAVELEPQERRFALQYLFQANLQNLIGRYPRYRELWDRYQGLTGKAEEAVLRFTASDITDLQVLSQLAWFDEFWLGQPEVAELIRKGRGFTPADQQFVIARQQELLASVLPAYAAAARRGGIEISTSPFYHPILPLVCDTNAGAASHEGLRLPRQRFRHPEDAREQIMRGIALHEQVFGMRPRGMWPSEGSVSDEAVAIASQAGLRWMASDEGVLARSLATRLPRDAHGNLLPEGAEKLYRIYRWEQQPGGMRMIFRDHSLSDLIGFVYSGMPAQEAARDFIRRIKTTAAPLLAKGIDAVVPVILDGENAWEYYPQSGREFLRRLYDGILKDPVFEALTVSEAIDRQASGSGAVPLPSIHPGSWINANFDVWIGAPEDNLSWDHLAAARDFFAANAVKATPQARDLAFQELLIAEGSDWNWWYGPEHHSINDTDFDELYRKHLSNVYQALGAQPPDVLAQPIIGSYAQTSFTPQSAYISPRIGIDSPGYFDWMGAAMHTADRRTSAMHGHQAFLDTGYAGIDAAYLYCRLDFVERVSEWASNDMRVVITVEAYSQPSSATAQTHRLEALVSRSGLQTSNLDGTESSVHDGLLVSLRKELAVECRVPLQLLSAAHGTILHVRFSLWRDRLPMDALPREGSIELYVVPEDELGQLAYAKP